jgi:hypothetical protein
MMSGYPSGDAMGIQEIDQSSTASAAGTTETISQLLAERDALRVELDRVRRPKARVGRMRRAVTVALIVLASLSFPVALSAAWTRSTLLNTDRWVETVAPIVEHPSVTDAMSRRISAEVMTLLNTRRLVEEAFPRAALLAAPLTEAVGDFVEDQVNGLLASDRFKEMWVNANRFAHAQIVSVLRGEGEVLTSADGRVVLNLVPVVNQVLARVEARGQDLIGRDVDLPEISSGEVPEVARQKLEEALGVSVPPDLGEIVIYESNRLEGVQEAVKRFDRGVILLAVLATLVIVGALWASRNRRRTLIHLSTGILLGLVIVRRSLMYVQDQAVDLARPENRTAAQAIVEDLTRGFFSLTQVVMIVLLALIALALITGPSRWAVSLRQLLRSIAAALGRSAGETSRGDAMEWVRAHRDGLQLGGAIVAVVLLLLTDVSWPIFLLLAALLCAYELALFRIGGRDSAPSG